MSAWVEGLPEIAGRYYYGVCYGDPRTDEWQVWEATTSGEDQWHLTHATDGCEECRAVFDPESASYMHIEREPMPGVPR